MKNLKNEEICFGNDSIEYTDFKCGLVKIILIKFSKDFVFPNTLSIDEVKKNLQIELDTYLKFETNIHIEELSNNNRIYGRIMLENLNKKMCCLDFEIIPTGTLSDKNFVA